MTATTDFQIEPDVLTLADGAEIYAATTIDIESDDGGSYFEVTGVRWENCRVEKTDWRWSLVSEWVKQEARKTFGVVREAHASACGAGPQLVSAA